MMSDTIDRATQLLAMTQRLVGMIELEIEAMKARRMLGQTADWDEKERLVHAWRIEVSKGYWCPRCHGTSLIFRLLMRTRSGWWGHRGGS